MIRNHKNRDRYFVAEYSQLHQADLLRALDGAEDSLDGIEQLASSGTFLTHDTAQFAKPKERS